MNIPETRDHDHALCYIIWAEEFKSRGIHIDDVTIPSMMIHMHSGLISKQSTIERCRRNINQKHKDTRGRSYNPPRKKPITEEPKIPTWAYVIKNKKKWKVTREVGTDMRPNFVFRDQAVLFASLRFDKVFVMNQDGSVDFVHEKDKNNGTKK
jgi:hypothetical protein